MASLTDDVKKMQLEGLSEDQIIQALQQRGMAYSDISRALEQSKIKAAVENGSDSPPQNTMEPPQTQEMQDPSAAMNNQLSQETSPSPYAPDPGMEPSMQTPAVQTNLPNPEPAQDQQPQGEYTPEYPQDPSMSEDYGGAYDQYEPYQQSALSPDTITEISEQIVSEKIQDMRKHIEKVLDFKTTAESKVEYLDERLKRIEKILDSLQSSVLKRVGDYVTDVQDIKTELADTQKTFSKLVPELRKKSTRKRSTTRKRRTSKKK